MTTVRLLPTLLRSFFEDHLSGQRDVSPNTIMAYRDAFLLFLRFAAKRNNRQVIRLQLEDLGPATLQDFLTIWKANEKTVWLLETAAWLPSIDSLPTWPHVNPSMPSSVAESWMFRSRRQLPVP
jgi:Phage integrase, N-terminal SAM-like domain